MGNESLFEGLMTVIYNGDLTIKKIINPQDNLLLKFNAGQLIGTNINELENISVLKDKKSIITIIRNVKDTNSKKKKFFKYLIEINDTEKVYAICMAEQHNDGCIYVNVIRTNQSNITDDIGTFRSYTLDSSIYSSTIGFSISHINKYGEKNHLIFNEAIRKMYGKEDITLSPNWDENEDNKADSIALENESYTFDKRLYDENGSLQKLLMTTKKAIKCSDKGHFIISTTTDITSLYKKYSVENESIISIQNSNNSITYPSQTIDNIVENNLDKNLLNLIYNNAPLGIIIYDKNGNLFHMNNKNREIMGIDSASKIKDINLFNEPNLPKEYIQKLKKGQNVEFDLDYNFESIKGYFETTFTHVKRLHITINIIWNKETKDGYLLTNQDMTSDIALYNELQNSIKKNKLILDNIGTGLAYIDANYNIVWKNQSYNEIYETNISDDELIKNQCYKTNHKRMISYENCIIDKVLKSGTIKKIHNFKNSHDVYDITGLPVKDDNDNIIGVIIRLDRITKKYKAKKKSESISKMFQRIIDNLPLGLYIKNIDDDFKYIIVNKTVCKLSKLKPEQCVGKTDFDILDNEGAKEFRKDDEEIVRRFAETNLPVIINKRLLLGGSNKVLKTINLVFKHENKNILISIAHNETERELMIKELNIAKEHAEESDRLKSAFLANMSHEIRTPLNAIVGFSEIIATNENKEENEEYIKIIQRNNQILLRLINDILDLSKIDAGAIKLRNSEFNLADLDNYFTSFYDNNKLNDDVEFITDLPYSRCMVNLDEQRFMQVCNNFISNSIKYTNKGYIKYGYSFENKGIKIYVKDTGIGIPKDGQDKLFTRFGKLNDNIQGNGLGLAICKAIIDMQNGKIGFQSEEGKGSIFWAWFPTDAVINTRTTEKSKYKIKDTIVLNNIKTPKEKSGINVLVAEDNDSNFLLLQTLLKGYKLVRAENGKRAVDLAKQSPFDLILMDMKMPIMGGLEATKLIRDFDKKVIIIALTASVFNSDLKAEKEAGCNEIITKPITTKGRECLFEIIKNIE